MPGPLSVLNFFFSKDVNWLYALCVLSLASLSTTLQSRNSCAHYRDEESETQRSMISKVLEPGRESQASGFPGWIQCPCSFSCIKLLLLSRFGVWVQRSRHKQLLSRDVSFVWEQNLFFKPMRRIFKSPTSRTGWHASLKMPTQWSAFCTGIFLINSVLESFEP